MKLSIVALLAVFGAATALRLEPNDAALDGAWQAASGTTYFAKSWSIQSQGCDVSVSLSNTRLEASDAAVLAALPATLEGGVPGGENGEGVQGGSRSGAGRVTVYKCEPSWSWKHWPKPGECDVTIATGTSAKVKAHGRSVDVRFVSDDCSKVWLKPKSKGDALRLKGWLEDHGGASVAVALDAKQADA